MNPPYRQIEMPMCQYFKGLLRLPSSLGVLLLSVTSVKVDGFSLLIPDPSNDIRYHTVLVRHPCCSLFMQERPCTIDLSQSTLCAKIPRPKEFVTEESSAETTGETPNHMRSIFASISDALYQLSKSLFKRFQRWQRQNPALPEHDPHPHVQVRHS